MRFLRENPEFNSAKLRFLQFLCIAERVAVNVMNSNQLLVWSSRLVNENNRPSAQDRGYFLLTYILG